MGSSMACYEYMYDITTGGREATTSMTGKMVMGTVLEQGQTSKALPGYRYHPRRRSRPSP